MQPGGRNPAIKGHQEDVRSALGALGDVVIQYDHDGRILWCNPQLCFLLECAASDLKGKLLPELGIDIPVGPGSPAEDGPPESVVHTGQGVRWFSWREVELEDEYGGRSRFALARDITHIKQREAALIEAREQAEQSSLAKSRLLATASHELRTPMNGVIGMAGLLAFTPLTPEQQTYVQAIRTSAESLLKLVNELLDLSRIEAGRLVLEPQRVSVRELIESVVELLAANAFEKDIAVASHIAPDVPDSFTVDPWRLRQVLFNLVGNAIKFTEKGGVLVTAECSRPDEIMFTVEDTGPGMNGETVARLFREFEQSGDRTRHPQQGVGLGLAITRRLVVAMGGYIAVETAPGQGAAFRVFLPLVAPEPSTESADVFAGLKVAVLTPREMEARALAQAVESRGGTVRLLSGEAEALAMIDEGHGDVDVLIADACLETGGEPMLARLRNRGLRTRRALTMIAPVDRPRLPYLREAGYNAFIARPPRGSTVVRLISGDLPSRPMQPSSERQAILKKAEIGHKLRVLLAEDNRINALLTEKTLSSAGCAVTWVRTGAEAMEAFSEAPRSYDLVVIDLNLPDACGLSVIEHIRSVERSKSIDPVVIVVLSADGQPATRRGALEMGANKFLQKPVEPSALMDLLAKLGES